jgi:hypothetical protein
MSQEPIMNVHRIDDQAIDALVCGELTGQEYLQAIERLEADPSRWRDCGLAFLREQAFSQSFKQLAQQNADWHAESVVTNSEDRCLPLSEKCVGVTANCESVQNALEELDSLPKPIAERPMDNWTGTRAWLSLASMAATAMLGFVIGQAWNGRFAAQWDRQQGTTAVQRTPAELPRDGTSIAATGSVATPVSPSETLRANFGGSSSNKLAGSGNLNNQLLPIDLTIPERIRELERLGKIRVDSSSAVMPLRRDDGSSVLVPIQQLQIVPVVYSY